MDHKMLALVKEVHRKAIEQLQAQGPPPAPVFVSHTELPELPRGHELYREWNTYRRHVAELLAMGIQGAWVLVKEDRILGTYGRWEHAYIAALEKTIRLELRLPFMIHQLREDEDISKLESSRISCPLSPSPLAKTA